jgi:hypothetical protein
MPRTTSMISAIILSRGNRAAGGVSDQWPGGRWEVHGRNGCSPDVSTGVFISATVGPAVSDRRHSRLASGRDGEPPDRTGTAASALLVSRS